MITLSILLAALILIGMIILVVAGGILAIFGDLIVAGLVIWLVVKLVKKSKKKPVEVEIVE